MASKTLGYTVIGLHRENDRRVYEACRSDGGLISISGATLELFPDYETARKHVRRMVRKYGWPRDVWIKRVVAPRKANP